MLLWSEELTKTTSRLTNHLFLTTSHPPPPITSLLTVSVLQTHHMLTIQLPMPPLTPTKPSMSSSNPRATTLPWPIRHTQVLQPNSLLLDLTAPHQLLDASTTVSALTFQLKSDSWTSTSHSETLLSMLFLPNHIWLRMLMLWFAELSLPRELETLLFSDSLGSEHSTPDSILLTARCHLYWV